MLHLSRSAAHALLTLCAGMAHALPADINGDGQVSAVDVQLAINAALGVSIDPHPSSAADVTGNGQVDATDVQVTINYALGILPFEPPEAGLDIGAPGQIPVGEPFTVTVNVADNGQPLAHVAVALSADPDIPGLQDGARSITRASGEAVFSGLSLSEPGEYEITAATGQTSTTATLTGLPSGAASETGVLHPGEFTNFEGGLMVGAHPHAIEEPLEVEVEWFDPAAYPEFAAKNDHFRAMERFIKITATNLDEEAPFAAARIGAAFIVAVPVPEHFDTGYLVPVGFDYGDFAMDHGDGDFIDKWLEISGVFDPDHRLFLADVPFIGGPAYPTRLGVVEHIALETEASGPILDWLIAERFPEAEQVREPRDLPPWQIGLNAAEGGPAKSVDVSFDVQCRLGFVDGPPNQFLQYDTARCEEEAIIDVLEHIEAELLVANGAYRGLEGNPFPQLSIGNTEGHPQFPTAVTLKYQLNDEYSRWTCGRGIAGQFRPWGTAFTCLHAAGDLEGGSYDDLDQAGRTTRHELFHAIQYDYYTLTPNFWVVEGTARLAEDAQDEDIGLAISTHSSRHRKVDLSLLERSGPDDTRRNRYEAEFFWFDLLKRSGLDELENLGLVFQEGVNTRNVHDFVVNHTEFDSLGEAHWRWVRNAAFDGDIELPTRWGGYRYTHRCEPNWDVFLASHRFELDGPVTFTAELEPLAATMLELELPANTEHHYYQVSFETLNPGRFNAPGRPGPMTRLYTQESEADPITGDCLEIGESVMAVTHAPDAEDPSFPLEGTVGTVASAAVDPSAAESRTLYLLISNPDRFDIGGPAEYEISITGPHYDAGSVPFPDEGAFHPTANDYHVELGSDTGGQIDALENDEPGYGGGELTVVAPDGEIQTGAGNTVETVAGAFWYTIADSGFEGGDSFEYTIENEHGFQDSATVTVTRDITPIAEDISRSLPLAESGPIEINVLAEASNPIEGSLFITRIDPVIGFDTGLIPVYEVPIIGDVEITGPESAQVIEYTPGPIENIFLGYVDRFVYTIENELGLTDWAVVTVARGGADDPGWGDDFEIAEEDIVVAPDPGQLDICRVHFNGPVTAWAARGQDGLRRSVVEGLARPFQLPGFADGETVVKNVLSDGVAVGWFSDDAGAMRPFAWSEGDGMLDLTPEAAGVDFQGRAMSITETGLIIGHMVPMEGDPFSVPVLWDDGDIVNLGEHFDTSAVPTAANEHGQVIGVSGLADPAAKSGLDGAEAFIAPPDPLDSFGPSGPACGVGPTLDDQLLTHGAGGFVYTPDSATDLGSGEMTPLDSLGGGATVPRAINDSGVVVGSSLMEPGDTTDTREQVRGFLWDAERGMVALPTLGGAYGEAFDVNSAGVVVGVSERADGESAAFVWEQGMLVDLNDLLPSGSPWRFTMATEVSEDGAILAWGYNAEIADGELYPVVLPAPSGGNG